MTRRLHIGGKVRKEGWEVLNAVASPCVDHVCDAGDLGQFADGTFDEVYASHVLEHFDYATSLMPTLIEWQRVLKPGGRLFVSVPDLDILAGMLLDKASLDVQERYYVMRIIFGGHVDQYDYHQVGLNAEFLSGFLNDAGFVNLRRAPELGIFEDTSSTRFKGTLISLNVIAEKPASSEAEFPAAGNQGSKPEPTAVPEIEGASGAADSQPVRDDLILETRDGIRISVPPTLECFTTYVLLEQERWFEKETEFVSRFLEDGMVAIDIGANLGLYSLSMSRSVGGAGHVYAYEPGRANRRHMENSIRLNAATNLTVSACALSDTEKKGWLHIASSGEFNALVDAGTESESTEAVEVTTLDAQSRLFHWQRIDFVKIDAEGQEARILVGGRDFFTRFSPLVMYEIKEGHVYNLSTRWMFELIGYRSYRLIGDASFLVPLRADEPLDGYELNLFSAKPDRAEKLARQGLLASDPQPFLLSASERAIALQRMVARPYARSLEISLGDLEQCPFVDALAAFAAYLYLGDLDVDRKYAALLAAFECLGEFCRTSANPAALSTYARVARDLGHQSKALDALNTISTLTEVEIDQPFFPALARFDDLETGESVAQWFLAAAFEQQELLRAYTSKVHHDVGKLQWLCENSPVSAEMLRRMILVGLWQGVSRRQIQRYLEQLGALSTRNASVWSLDGGGLAGLQ